jgi:predicted dehydrogenase
MAGRPLDAVMVGAGSRGFFAYGPYALAHPDEIRFTAVAEPDEGRRRRFAEAHGIPPARSFASWEELMDGPPVASVAVNATMDRTHLASTSALLESGYHVLLEKPMATSPEACVELVRAAEQAQRMLMIGHVMRYAPFFVALHEVVESGRLGDLVSVDWRENLSYGHFAHSFVRGRWSNSALSSPMILAKCCHDLDQLVWTLPGRPRRLSSFGSLRHFGPHAVGLEVPGRCTDGCPRADSCEYYAPRQYLGEDGEPTFYTRIGGLGTTADGVMEQLRTGPYGRCVYRSDNDVVDHQVVLMDFDGLAVSMTMQGASHVEGRTIRIDGMHATLLANEARNQIVIVEHLTGSSETIDPERPASGHGGGDEGIMRAFVAALSGDESQALTAARDSLDSHFLAFAAERARLEGLVIDLDEYRRTYLGDA